MGAGFGKPSSSAAPAVARAPSAAGIRAADRPVAQEPDPDDELWAMIMDIAKHSSVPSSQGSGPSAPAPMRFYVFFDNTGLVAAPAGARASGGGAGNQAAARTARGNQRARPPWTPRRRFAELPPLRLRWFKFNRNR